MRVLVCIVALVLSCATDSEIEDWETLDSAVETLETGEHWSVRYIEDNCARCPECCVQITENGFIDEYGVERPTSWLPDEPLLGDVDQCYDCPGCDCICVMDGAGLWWVDATLGDD